MRTTFQLACLASIGLLAACSTGGDGSTPQTALAETEGNDTSASANAVAFDRPAMGSLATAGDVDFWAVKLSNGQWIQIELFATRVNQAAWNTAGNVPRLTLYDTDGATKLLEHDYSGFTSTSPWSWGKHDLDVPGHLIRTDGTYFVAVTQDNTTLAGSDYVFEVTKRPYTNLQFEASALANSHATTATADPLQAGLLVGFHFDDEDDFYTFTTTAPGIARFELTSYRNGLFQGDDSYFDTELSLVAADGVTTLRNNDDAFFYDSAIHYRLDAAGTYFIDVIECCDAGDAEYYLAFEFEALGATTPESEANDTAATAQAVAFGEFVDAMTSSANSDFFSFAGTAGDLIRVQVFDPTLWDTATTGGTAAIAILDTDGVTPLDYGFGSQFQSYNFFLPATGTYYVRADASLADVPYGFVAERFLSSAFESEANDSIATADSLDNSGRASGVIGTAGDHDFFAFSASGGRRVTVRVHADEGPQSNGFFEYQDIDSALDVALAIVDSGGLPLALSDYSLSISTESVVDGLPSGAVTFVPPASGTFYVDVFSSAGTSGSDYHYVIVKR
jgi:hypothetical protein